MRLQSKSPIHWFILWALIGLFLSAATVLSAEASRTWTSADGQRTFEGVLLDYNDYTRKVTVERNGQKLTFHESVLSKDDIEYVKLKAPDLAPIDLYGTGSTSSSSSLGSLRISGSVPDVLPDPDGSEAKMNQPVQVFILMGQSNMLGFGNAGKLKGTAEEKYPYLVDDAGNWNVRKDVRNVFYCMGKLRYNDWLTAENGNGSGKFGPEIGIGNYLGHVIDAPVLILKSCVGNRALGWDLLPPSAVGTGVNGKSYQGNSESSNRQINTDIDGWYAGRQYDQDVGAAQNVLRNLSTYYPGATEYEVAGFFWWQGNAERGKGSVENYDKNLAFLFDDLRKDFNAPNAKFVCATLGEHDKGATLSQKMFDFADSHDDAKVFYSKPVANGGSGGHYGGDPDTYMKVGEGMGKLMLELLSQ
ncbi:MAG: sialate O-acetylesterase [Opitutales bacterium]